MVEYAAALCGPRWVTLFLLEVLHCVTLLLGILKVLDCTAILLGIFRVLHCVTVC